MTQVACLVPVSGGKDSQSVLKLAVTEFGAESVMGLFCDTQFEHPLTYAHVEKLKTLYGPIQFSVITAGTVLEKSLKYKRFPGGGARHCTDELKIQPTKKFCKQLAEQQGGFEVWYGMRSNESSQRNKRYAGKTNDELYAPHEVMPRKYPKYLAKLGVMFKLPILDWTEEEVFEYLQGEHNPLYNAGFTRVGCFPCLAGGDKSKKKAFEFDEFGKKQYVQTLKVSEIIKKSIWTSKKGILENSPGCAVCEI